MTVPSLDALFAHRRAFEIALGPNSDRLSADEVRAIWDETANAGPDYPYDDVADVEDRSVDDWLADLRAEWPTLFEGDHRA